MVTLFPKIGLFSIILSSCCCLLVVVSSQQTSTSTTSSYPFLDQIERFSDYGITDNDSSSSSSNSNNNNTTTAITIPTKNTYRTNICKRQQLLSDDRISFRYALEELDISVAITNYAGIYNEDLFFAINETIPSIPALNDDGTYDEYPGLFVIILDELAKRAKFRWRDSFVPIDPLNSTTDGNNRTWSDLLEWEIQHFDIAIDYWGRTKERMERGISFPKGWYSGNIILVTSKDSLKPSKYTKFESLWSFLLPFHSFVWWAVIGAIIITGIVYFLLERLDPKSDERGEIQLGVAIYLSSIVFTGHFQYRPTSHASRLLSFSWTFWALIMTSAYTANLASFLVSRSNRDKDANTISTLDDAVQQGIPICVQRNSAMDDYISTKYPELIIVKKDTEQDIFLGLQNEWYTEDGCGAAVTNYNTYQIYKGRSDINPNCNTLQTEKRTIYTLPSGFATAVDTGIYCTSLISHVLDLHFTEMHTDGFIERAWINHVNRLAEVNCDDDVDSSYDSLEEQKQRTASLKTTTTTDLVPDGDENNADVITATGEEILYGDDNMSLSMNDMAGIFITHAALTLVAILFAISDYHTRKRLQRLITTEGLRQVVNRP